jgi:hypothetical protein
MARLHSWWNGAGAPEARLEPRREGASRRRLPELVAACLGVGWFLLAGGWRALPPTALDWLRGDTAQHVLGWLFFRSSAWALPLGAIDGLAWPTGTTVGFTDANPLLAIPLKLASPLLPRDFQYVGAWLAACFALQGWFGARLAALASERPGWRVLGGALFALAPALLQRRAHDTLCAHWALLALLLLHLHALPDRAAARSAVRRAAALTVVFTLVHPYLAVMALGLTVALLARVALVERHFGLGAALLRALALLVAQVGLLALQGYFTAAPSHAQGFGLFSFDLLAFVNPWGSSSLLPDLPLLPEQLEGYAYLGAGALALVALATGLLVARGRQPFAASPPDPVARAAALVPLLVAVLAMALFALSPSVRAAGRELLDARPLFRPLMPLAGPLRSSGRFVWPLYYLLLTGALLVVGRRLARTPRLASALLAGAVALQVVDLAPRAAGAHFTEHAWRLRAPEWSLARGHYDLVALDPPLVVGVWSRCRGLVYGDDSYWIPLGELAYRLGMSVNSGQLARGAAERLNAGCDSLTLPVERGAFRPRTLYVVHPSRLPLFQGRPGAVCGRVEGYDVCVSAEQQDAFRAALAR